ncbi:MAG: hypothetical protein QMC65_05870 [Candidatus Poseidoniaceae archaeon]|jgi:hypothetical protein|tara:strand:+ start:2615 stop:3724 length:1110 start_codon:yes stop_codon:yes gene_type:complete
MGITAMIPDMTIGQLANEAESRWGEIWDQNASRMLVLLICPRKERKLLELHGDMVEHGQPVLTVFHRPRREATLLEEQEFNPRDASFQFVNLASPDMGPWMQHLITNEKWMRSSIEIVSVPFTMDMPSQRPFETERILCFRHPSLPPLERYYLPFPPSSIPGKCFVSLPRRQAAEFARQQAEVLGVGRLEKKVKITEASPSEMPVAVPSVAEEANRNMDDMMNDFSSNLLDSMTEEILTEEPELASLPLPPTESKPKKADGEHVFIPLPPGAETAEQERPPTELPETPAEPEMLAEPSSNNVPIPEPVPEPEPEMSNIEREFRELVTGLLAAGVAPSDMMDDPRWENLNERASAEGFETWPVFLQLAAM